MVLYILISQDYLRDTAADKNNIFLLLGRGRGRKLSLKYDIRRNEIIKYVIL